LLTKSFSSLHAFLIATRLPSYMRDDADRSTQLDIVSSDSAVIPK